MIVNNWYLERIVVGSGETQRITLRPLPFRVGRHIESDLLLESSHGSQHHAELYEHQGHLWLRDLGSTNGTSVNGERLFTEKQLQIGDTVHFADVEYRVAGAAASNAIQQTQVFSNTERRRLVAMVREPKAFGEMIKTRSLWTHFQPLVDLRDGSTFGYEVLGRGRLDDRNSSPGELFYIAEKLKKEVELSTMFRRRGLELAADLDGSAVLFVNTHPAELKATEALHQSMIDLRRDYPSARLVLEIHEAAVADIEVLKTLRAQLLDLDIELAFDDFGTGQTRLLELVEVEPRYLKFDAVFIEGLHRASQKRRDMVRSLLKVVLDLGISPIAECIESAEEAAACRELGFEIGQGYYFGRPSPAAAYSGDHTLPYSD